MNFFRIFLIFVICFMSVASSAAIRPESIRVALYNGLEKLTIDGTGLLLTDKSGFPLRFDTPLEITRSKNAISINGKIVSSLIASAPARVSINGKGYRGLIEVSAVERGLLVVNELPLEEYLVGLINCEISSAWPMEAIKSQAVIARSYALYQKNARKGAPYHLESTVMDQVYDGIDSEDSRAVRGVLETSGEVLIFDGKIIQAFYHSNCAGHTESSERVWGLSIPYLRGVDCRYCLASNPIRWQQSIELKKLEGILSTAGYPVFNITEIKVGSRNESGRVNEVIVACSNGIISVPGVAFRKALGYGFVKSTKFEILTLGESCLISGSGSGHGVGLCQWGAKERAQDGFSYREILSYYYPGVKISKGSGY